MKLKQTEIEDGFWRYWLDINAHQAIYHQWEHLEQTGCIDNFRIVAEKKDVFRTGWFFSDSDAYKWLEAASRIIACKLDPKLQTLVDAFIELIQKTQDPTGYLFTYNQIHFPSERWTNLQIEHELYCHGHLIEAGVSHYQATGDQRLLKVALKAAQLIVYEFKGKGPAYTPGHEEIEIALLRLYEISDNIEFYKLAVQFLEMRGRRPLFGLSLVKQSVNTSKRSKAVKAQQAYFKETHPNYMQPTLPKGNIAKKAANSHLRWLASALSGKLLQQHQPLKKQLIPVGHSVRFTYLNTAAAMTDRLGKVAKYTISLEYKWNQMQSKRMYITGGIGSLPQIEGFGKDYELDPEYAYTETCAALGSLFWNREMSQLTNKACYSDLFEWQLYNAALVGMGLDGKTYLYNNPLKTDGNITRKPWYSVPCCPSNLSRTWANLQNDIVSVDEDEIYIQQYISSNNTLELEGQEIHLEIRSEFPWSGKVVIWIKGAQGKRITLKLRKPSWVSKGALKINQETIHAILDSEDHTYNPQKACWIPIEHTWQDNDCLRLDLVFPIQLFLNHEKVKSCRGKAAITLGPIVYCLESCDNPDVDFDQIKLSLHTLNSHFETGLLGGTMVIDGKTISGESLRFIPYFLWGNRGPSKMSVFVRLPEEKL